MESNLRDIHQAHTCSATSVRKYLPPPQCCWHVSRRSPRDDKATYVSRRNKCEQSRALHPRGGIFVGRTHAGENIHLISNRWPLSQRLRMRAKVACILCGRPVYAARCWLWRPVTLVYFSCCHSVRRFDIHLFAFTFTFLPCHCLSICSLDKQIVSPT